MHREIPACIFYINFNQRRSVFLQMSNISNKNMIKERLLMSLIYENGARSTEMEARGGDADARVRKSSTANS